MANEKRLIDANALIKEAYAEGAYGYVDAEQIADVPTVDAVEVKCKVGDFVYALWEAPVKLKYIIYCAEVKEIRISIRNCRLTTTYMLEPIDYRGRIREYRDYTPGKFELSWDIPEERIALVKDCGYTCDPDARCAEECADCPAKEFCDDYLEMDGDGNG